jgi:hypothetical protein
MVGGGGIVVGYGTSDSYSDYGAADLTTRHIITGNQIVLLPLSDYHGIHVATNGSIIVDNTITILEPYGAGDIGILLKPHDANINLPIRDILVANNTIFQAPTSGIHVRGGQGISVSLI